MKFEAKALSVALLLATLSVPAHANIDVGFSDVFSRGNVEDANNNSVEYIIGVGVNDVLTQINFNASVLANPLLSPGFFVDGTPFSDLSVLVRYQEGATDLSVNLGFDVLNATFISADVADPITGSLQNPDGSTHLFPGWVIKSGGKLTFSFNELNDEANFDGLTGIDYWDAQWQNGSTLSLVTAPVPEPETYAMMLAGLGLVAFAARRRKSMR